VSRVSSGRGSGWADGGILVRGRGELADIKARDAGRGAAGRKERVSAIRQAVRSGGGRRQEASRTNAGTIVETPPKYRIDSRPHLLALSYSQFSWARPRPVKFTRNPGDDLSPLLPASSLPVFLSPLPSLSLSHFSSFPYFRAVDARGGLRPRSRGFDSPGEGLADSAARPTTECQGDPRPRH
jgi:hypothetical protein